MVFLATIVSELLSSIFEQPKANFDPSTRNGFEAEEHNWEDTVICLRKYLTHLGTRGANAARRRFTVTVNDS